MILGCFGSYRHWADDLMQEALIHAWRMEESNPGQSPQWHVESSRRFLRDYLKHGRSLDSPKRMHRHTVPIEGWDDGSEFDWESLPDESEHSGVIANVHAREATCRLQAELARRDRPVFVVLCQDPHPTDAAHRLRMSRTEVVRSRQRIARIARKLGTEPLPG